MRPARRRGRQRIRSGRPTVAAALVTAVAVLVLAVGPARAGLLVAGAVVAAAVVRMPRVEARLFDSRPATTPLRAEVVARPVQPPAGAPAMNHDAHRAYARALHAVTAAYLAEIEQEARR